MNKIIQKKIDECLKKATAYFGITFPQPEIKMVDNLMFEGKKVWGICDTTREPQNGGIGSGKGNSEISLCCSLSRQLEQKIELVTTHEMGHHIASLIYPDGHGEVWMIVMEKAFGCHDLSVSLAK